MRSAPNETREDNFSTRGNTNPYTYEPGTQPLEPYNYSKSSGDWGFTLFWFIVCSLFYLLYRFMKRPVRKPSQDTEVRKHTKPSKTQSKPRPKGNCPKCGGLGHIPRFSHINNGKCYQCNGIGFATKDKSFSGNQYPANPNYGEDNYVEGLTDVFDRDEICDPDLLENWDEEYRSRNRT